MSKKENLSNIQIKLLKQELVFQIIHYVSSGFNWASNIVNVVDESYPTVYRKLDELESANILKSKFYGSTRVYEINKELPVKIDKMIKNAIVQGYILNMLRLYKIFLMLYVKNNPDFKKKVTNLMDIKPITHNVKPKEFQKILTKKYEKNLFETMKLGAELFNK